MRRLMIPALLVVCVSASPSFAQSNPLDLIPADAAAALILRNPDELRKKGDDFLKEAELNFGIRPTDLLDMAANFLGLKDGVDYSRPAGAILLPYEKGQGIGGFEQIEQCLYVAIPFTDLDKMADNFGFEKGAVKPDQILKRKNEGSVNWFMVRDKTVYLAISETPLKRMQKRKALTDVLAAEQVKAFAKSDLVFLVGPKAFGDEWGRTLKNIERDFEELAEAPEKEAARQLTKSLESLKFGLGGIRIDGGLGLSFLTAFEKDSKPAQEFLASLKSERPSDLKGLPEGKVVIAQSYAGDGAKSSLFARALLHVALKDLFETSKLTSAADRPSFVGVFNEVWQRLQGNRVGVYLTRDESKLGLFSIVGILDTADAPKFLAEMRTLAKMAEGKLDLKKKGEEDSVDIAQLVKDLGDDVYKVRAAANTKLRLIGEPAIPHLEKALEPGTALETTRRAKKLISDISQVAAERRKELLAKDLPRFVRPTFAWVGKAEKRQGLDVDIVHIKLSGQEELVHGQMKQFFGPDWDKLRLAVIGKQVVILLGSETELFDQALANVKDGKPGLADSKLLADFRKQKNSQPSGEFHAAVSGLMKLVDVEAKIEPSGTLSSFSLAVRSSELQLDLFVPSAEIRVLGKRGLFR